MCTSECSVNICWIKMYGIYPSIHLLNETSFSAYKVLQIFLGTWQYLSVNKTEIPNLVTFDELIFQMGEQTFIQ
jgi:hypothetical protein